MTWQQFNITSVNLVQLSVIEPGPALSTSLLSEPGRLNNMGATLDMALFDLFQI